MERTNMRTGIMKLMLAVVFVFGSLLFVPGLSADVKAGMETSGTCGDNVTWEITSSGPGLTLTISGTGAMNNFSSSPMPWNDSKQFITSVVIEEIILQR